MAKLAGISSGLVYQYVREKEDVLLLVLLDVIDAYAREIPKSLVGIDDPIGRLVTAIESYCRVIDRHRDGAVLAYRSTKSLSPPRRRLIQQKEAETNALIAAELRACMKAGLVRKVDLDVLVYHIVMAAHTWALKSVAFQAAPVARYLHQGDDRHPDGRCADASRHEAAPVRLQRRRKGKTCRCSITSRSRSAT